MSLIREKEYDVSTFITHNDVLQQIADDWGMIFEADADSTTSGRIYLDKEKNIFLYSNNSMVFYLCHSDKSIKIDYFSYVPKYIFTDRNADGAVLYLRGVYSYDYGDARNSAFIVAKDKSGDWSCFAKHNIITKDGVFSLGTTSAVKNTSMLYSAFPMPNIINGEVFLGLYKVFTAQTFSAIGSYVDFNDTIFRAVDSQGGVSNAPNYAFEARQE